MFFKKCKAFVVMLFVASLVLAGCTAAAEAPTPTVEIPPEPTPSAQPTATELPAPTDTATPEPTATTVPYPSARGFHSMVYEPEADVILLFGGRMEDEWHLYDDIWAYKTNTNAWLQVGSISKMYLSSTYHSEAKQVVLYAGGTSNGGSWKAKGKTQTYDFITNTRESMPANEMPYGYLGTQLAYDEESGVIILYGGYNVETTQIFDDTFAYDLNTNTWTNMVPTTKPPARELHAMVYHPTLDRVVMFGGRIMGSEGRDETWMYDYNTNAWELIPVTKAPSGREDAIMVYVASTDQIILFGGRSTMGGSLLNDLWAFDLAEKTWIELYPDNAPSIRAWHAMAYDSKADKIVLFGGGKIKSVPTNETWIYDPQTNTWTDMTPGN